MHDFTEYDTLLHGPVTFPVSKAAVCCRWARAIGLQMRVPAHNHAGAEVRRAGLATHFVPSAALPQLEAALRAGGAAHRGAAAVAATLASFEVLHLLAATADVFTDSSCSANIMSQKGRGTT